MPADPKPAPTGIDETYEPRPWRCGECRLVLGVVMRDTSRVRSLYLFFRARTDEQMPTARELFDRPRGLIKSHGIHSEQGEECPLCGARTEWTPSKESFDKLMSHFRREGWL